MNPLGESERLLFVAHGIGCQSRFTQVHRGRQVVVRNLGCLLEQFDRCGIIALLVGDIALQTYVLGIDDLCGNAFGRFVFCQVGGRVVQVAQTQVADAGIVLGQVARTRGTVLVDDIEEAGAVGIAFESQLVFGRGRFEPVLGLSDHLGRLTLAGLRDQLSIAEDGCGEYEEGQQRDDHRFAVFLEKHLGFIHRCAECFLLVLLCHRNMQF